MIVTSIDDSMFKELVDIQPLAKVSPNSFANQLLAEISSVNNKLNTAETSLQDMAAGKSSNIHHVMLALEEAKMSFELMMQVRNKLLDGYQDILRMQV